MISHIALGVTNDSGWIPWHNPHGDDNYLHPHRHHYAVPLPLAAQLISSVLRRASGPASEFSFHHPLYSSIFWFPVRTFLTLASSLAEKTVYYRKTSVRLRIRIGLGEVEAVWLPHTFLLEESAPKPPLFAWRAATDCCWLWLKELTVKTLPSQWGH